MTNIIRGEIESIFVKLKEKKKWPQNKKHIVKPLPQGGRYKIKKDINKNVTNFMSCIKYVTN